MLKHLKARRKIINSQLNEEMTINNNDCLSAEQRHVFMDVITESLRISQRTHLFNWLQGELQYLLGHEVMIFGIKSSENDSYHFEYFTSTRYFNEEQFNNVIEKDLGLISQISKIWRETTLPLFVTDQEKLDRFNNFSVINFSDPIIKKSELKNFVIHGFGDSHSKISSIVIFGRLHKLPSINFGNILELITPHLHCALVRITSSRSNVVVNASTTPSIMTKRESEILQWLHMGKTNWEISSILDISQLTVKNHVQNILRKLDVQNRSQAAVKAAKLGLIKVLK